MRILYFGDVVGRSGREALNRHLPVLKKDLKADCVIVCGENAASGFGVNEQIVKAFLNVGADVITCGDHCFDQPETKFFINQYPQMLRPFNMPSQLSGKGYNIYDLPLGKKILVIHLLAQLFVRYQVNCPFQAVTEILEKHRLGRDVDYIFVDFHGEATSEKMAMGQYLDGKVSAVVGSHTHVPTADHQVLPKGTAYQTDAGMCGDYDSVIGFQKEISVPNFLNKIRGDKMKPAEGEGTVCGVAIDLDEKSGLAKRIKPIRIGGKLSEIMPDK